MRLVSRPLAIRSAAMFAAMALIGCTQSVNSGRLESAAAPVADPAKIGHLSTQVFSLESAGFDEGPWGTIHVYHEGDTDGTRQIFAAKITLKPGMEVHPPHKHVEEEYLLVASGNGTWTVGTQTFPAKAGDLLYAAPWDNHGIISGGDEPMVFYVWKWVS